MAEPEPSGKGTVDFEGVTPILAVRDLDASIDYYTRVLGFRVDWKSPGVIAAVSRGRCGLFLCEGDQGHPGTWVWIGVTDAEQLFDEYRRAGARIRHPPTNYSWAYEMQVEDLDGHVLRLGSEPKEGQPSGEWLDMHGQRWQRTPAGWSRLQ